MKMSSLIIKKECILICFVIILNGQYSVGEGTQNLETCSETPNLFSEILLSLSSRLINQIGKEESFIISPLSISAALTMLYIGTDGLTKYQMNSALHYNLLPSKDILQNFRDLFDSLKSETNSISLAIANSVFIQKGYRVSQNYSFNVQKYFDSEINYVDFAHEELLSMNYINQWVSIKTQNQIEKLLNEPLDTMTVMVLANVIFFKGLWELPFQDTWRLNFNSFNGNSKTVSMMKQENFFNYYQDDLTNYKFLEMNYIGDNISMLLVLPVNAKEAPVFPLSSLCSIRNKLEMRRVMVGLPRFKLGYRRELSEDMRTFGMPKLFSDRADLTKIREQNDLHVSLMIHKAVIEVDERGSTASGISGIGIDSRKRPVHDAVFWADHPFLFYILEKRSGSVLFAGRVTDP